jgi:hypothetical protein
MSRSQVVTLLIGAGAILALWLLLQTPVSITDALLHPIQTVAGTGEQLNSTLLEASEKADPLREAGRRLLQPLGLVRLVRIYNAPDAESTKKR